MLEQRFGQPRVVAKGCVDAFVEGANISSSDRQGLREFTDRSRTLYETVQSMNVLSEMNMTNLAKMSGRLPIALQIKWRDEAQRIREKGRCPSLKELVEFIERRVEAANDPIFGKVGEVNKNFFETTSKGQHTSPTPRTHSRKWIQSDNICNTAWITYPRKPEHPRQELKRFNAKRFPSGWKMLQL